MVVVPAIEAIISIDLIHMGSLGRQWQKGGGDQKELSPRFMPKTTQSDPLLQSAICGKDLETA
jgi:hypothetical protein